MKNALIGCRLCGQVHEAVPLEPGQSAACRRCGSTLSAPDRSSLRWTAAFSSAALLLYGPANLFPILRLNMYGAVSESTVWQGCVKLYQGGDPALALIVVLASIVVPLLKLAGLFVLAVSSLRRRPRGRRARTWIYRVVDVIGRWAMLDVFMLAIVVSVMRFRSLATVVPGTGALAFAAVVVLTLLAAQSFDPRLIWDEGGSR
jgi:paraquat-inducible protein A